MRELEFLILDVFTDTPLEGNQLAVLPHARECPPELMQRLAREFNFSESVFVLDPQQDGDARIRIFTPTHELPFAGHPVLGTAIAIAGGRRSVRLETGVGVIPIELDQGGAFGRMLQRAPSHRPYQHADALLAALGVERSLLPVEVYDNGPLHAYVALESEQAVAELRPDMRALAELDAAANCFAGAGRDFKTRMFAPAAGVPEDPATGSAAGPLAVHLARHGVIGWGEQIEIRQGAEIGRPSLLYARADGTPEQVTRVEVAGAALVVARGVLSI